MMTTVYELFSSGVDQGLLPQMFAYEFLINALLASIMIGPLLGLLGTLVVVKRLAFLSEAVGHSVLTGVSIGILLGEPVESPLISLFSFSIFFALLLQWVKGRSTIPYDALIGVFLSFALQPFALQHILVLRIGPPFWLRLLRNHQNIWIVFCLISSINFICIFQ